MNHNPPPPRDQNHDRRILRSFAEGRTVEALAIHHDMNAIEVMHLVRRAVDAHVNGPAPAPATPALPTIVAPTPPAAPAVDRLGELLAGAAKSTSARTRREGQRLEAAVTALTAVVAEEKAAAERAEQEAAARREAEEQVARLRAELAQAEAALKAAKTGKAAARPAAAVGSAAPRGNGGPDPKAVRAWAARNGVDCNSHGRVPQTVVDAYLAALVRQVAA